jgi:hypothetical protein
MLSEYWGILISLLVFVVLLLVCMDILSCKSMRRRGRPTEADGTSSDKLAGPTAPSHHAT